MRLRLTRVRVVGRRLCIAIFEGGRKAFIGVGCAYGCNISESIIMTRRPPTTEIRILLRTILSGTILSAGVLAVLVLACAGTAACTDYGCAQAVEVVA